MDRRYFLTGLTLAITLTLIATNLPTVEAADPAQAALKYKRPLNIAQFDAAIKSISPARVAELDAALTYATIPQMQQLFQEGKLTSEELVMYYLWRISKYDVNKLNSVTELNPDALEIAKQLDTERKAGKVRGPLHGTTVLLKDIIGTGDKLHNTAGAAAMREAKSDRDAFIVKRLREAGVIILGKSALTEWGNFIAYKQANGYSTLGGQIVNPYRTASDPGGSSTGSAVATASNFTTFAIGEDSWGSLLIPAHANSTVALRPSIGMVSRDRMIPIVGAHDTAGPMTRNLTDLALVMDALVAADPNDPVTISALSAEKGFAQKLNGDGLRGKRVGVFAPISSDDSAINARTIAALQSAGAQVVEIPRLPSLIPDIFNDLDPITAFWVKTAGQKYFAETTAPVKTWQEVVAFNKVDAKNRVKYGQEYLILTRDSTMTLDEYDRRYRVLLNTWKSKMDAMLAKDNLDFVAGTGMAFLDGVFFPATGYPVLAIPAGYRPNNEPVGFILMGRLFDDAKLIRAGYALEQASKAWRPPKLAK